MTTSTTCDQTVDVSVIVPCYNTETFLDQCLTSIEANASAKIEIIVLNDGSTDGSLAIMRAHEQADERVRVIDKPNQGYGASVNRGISEARGTYIAIVEPDDYLKPGMYDTLVALARRYDFPDMVKSAYWRVWMPNTPMERLYHCSYYQRVKPAHQPFQLKDCPRLIQHHPSIWSALYKRSFLDDYAIRFKEVPGAGWVDNPFLIETCAQARTIVYTDDSFYCYREDLPGSSSVSRVATLSFERWNDMADVMDRLGIEDEGIRQALYVIGFRYAGAAIGEGALGDGELRRLIVNMFKRMDPALVARMRFLSGSFKKTYLSLTGYQVDHIERLPYLLSLADEFVYSWRTNGASFALSRLGVFVRRRAAEKGIGNPTKTHSASI